MCDSIDYRFNFPLKFTPNQNNNTLRFLSFAKMHKALARNNVGNQLNILVFFSTENKNKIKYNRVIVWNMERCENFNIFLEFYKKYEF
jgi:hypothetical protein